MAGTGGTNSSSPTDELSPRVLGVGSREVKRLWEMRCEPEEARQEL